MDSSKGPGNKGSGKPYIVHHVVSSPSNLLDQLEKVQLSDEDTERLLKDAYALNVKLKEELRRQESEGTSSHLSSSTSPSAKNRPQRLPPLQGRGSSSRSAVDVYAFRQSPPKKASVSQSAAPAGRAKCRSPSPLRKSSPTNRNSTKKTDRRPQWDDRFSCS